MQLLLARAQRHFKEIRPELHLFRRGQTRCRHADAQKQHARAHSRGGGGLRQPRRRQRRKHQNHGTRHSRRFAHYTRRQIRARRLRMSPFQKLQKRVGRGHNSARSQLVVRQRKALHRCRHRQHQDDRSVALQFGRYRRMGLVERELQKLVHTRFRRQP